MSFLKSTGSQLFIDRYAITSLTHRKRYVIYLSCVYIYRLPLCRSLNQPSSNVWKFHPLKLQAASPEDVPPIIATPHHYLISVYHSQIFLVAVSTEESEYFPFCWYSKARKR